MHGLITGGISPPHDVNPGGPAAAPVIGVAVLSAQAISCAAPPVQPVALEPGKNARSPLIAVSAPKLKLAGTTRQKLLSVPALIVSVLVHSAVALGAYWQLQRTNAPSSPQEQVIQVSVVAAPSVSLSAPDLPPPLAPDLVAMPALDMPPTQTALAADILPPPELPPPLLPSALPPALTPPAPAPDGLLPVKVKPKASKVDPAHRSDPVAQNETARREALKQRSRQRQATRQQKVIQRRKRQSSPMKQENLDRLRKRLEMRRQARMQARLEDRRTTANGQVAGARRAGRSSQTSAKRSARQANPASASAYRGLVAARLARNKPAGHLAELGSGTAIVSFSIAASGAATGIRLAKSAGHAALDRAALATVRRSSPFPPPPRGAGRAFRVPVHFSR